jgi:hypothetical protein
MGNTVLAHVLFSSNQAKLDLDNFFSDTGNSHNISGVNTTKLRATHLIEFPDENAKCILQLKSDGWFYILQYKFSYDKWFKEVPTLSNWNKFFKQVVDSSNDQTWQQFYSNVKDKSWPECESYDKIDSLPEYIIAEIKQLYQPSSNDISTNEQLLEFLTNSYFDNISKIDKFEFDAPVYRLSDYFDYNIEPLIQISKMLNWQWDNKLSKQFHSKMLEINARYLAWLDIVKQHHDSIVSDIVCPMNLDIWEKALLIAKVCQTLHCNPRDLKWQDSGCFLEQNTATLIKLLRG